MDRRSVLGWMVSSIAGATLAGCAMSRKPVDPAADDLSVVFGFIDMRDAPSNLVWVSLKGYGPGAPSYRAGVEDGLFFHVGVKPGAYQVDRFGGDRSLIPIFGEPYEYEWGTQGRNRTAIKVDRADAFFMGSYRYVRQPSGLFDPARFDMQPIAAPTEREALQKVLRLMEADSSLNVYRHQIRRLKSKVGTAA